MKKLTLILALVLLIMPVSINSMPLTPAPTITWEQDADTFAVMTHWRLEVADTLTGPFTVVIPIIPKPEGAPAPTNNYGGSYSIDLGNYPVGTTITKYFRLFAVTASEESGPSNVVGAVFKVEPGKPQIISIEVVPKK